MKWGQPFRVRHVTTGRYLALTEEKGLVVVDAEKANTKVTSFCFRVSKVRGLLMLRADPAQKGLLKNVNFYGSLGEVESGPKAVL